MKFEPIALHCDCGGRFPARIKQIGLTAERQFVIQWRCGSCKRTHVSVKTLAEYWHECPPIGHVTGALIKNYVDPQHDYDAQFLHRLGVALPEGDDA